MSGIGTRGGIGGGILAEKVEILWGDRGNPRQHALRKGELVDVQRIIEETRKSLADLRKSLELVKGDIDELNAAVDGIELELVGVQDRIDEAESALTALEGTIAVIDGRLTSIDTSILTLQTDVSHLQTDLAALQGDVGNVTTDVAFLQADLTALTARVGATEADITQLELDVNELELGMSSLPGTADLDTAVRNKEFQWSNTSANTPVAGSYGRGFTIASNSSDLTQVGIVNATGQWFMRYRTGGTWSAWADLVSLRAEPFALQSNPGATPFPAGAYTAIPLYTSTELTGITKTGSSTFTVPQAGLYLFELEVRADGGASSQTPVGTPIGISIDGTTVPTSLRAGNSAADTVAATTILRLSCTERLAAGAQRVPYILNQGAAAYQVASAVLKITRLSA